MDLETEFKEELDSSGIVKNLSAYHLFQKANMGKIREALGRDVTPGAVMSAISVKWKALSTEERAHYEAIALEDKERYQRECAILDEGALRRQEERRKAHALGETETRLRGSTLATTDASTLKDTGKRKREFSEKEKEKQEMRKQTKMADQEAQSRQMAELAKEKATQAEARLKYLLSQSDIFSHFGVGKEYQEQKQKKEAKPEGKKSRRSERDADEMDEDELAMAHEIGEGEDSEGDVDNVQTVLLKQPSIITGGQLRDYQLEGLNWMIRLHENGINGILADEMGLGKTLQSISVLAYMREFKGITGPHLVMVPKSTLSNWCNEFERFCPSIRILRFHGSKEERLELVEKHLKPARLRDDRDWDVLITTYEVLNLEKGPLSKIAWRYLIIDEAHRLKNEESQFAKTVRLLNTEHRLLLTGTPLQNNLHELWALLNFLLPDVFSSSEQFDEWFNLEVGDTEVKQRMISQLHKLLRPFMLRRLKADVAKTLPPKSELILFTGMSEVQRTLYKNILRRNIDEINNSSGSNSEQSRTAILNIVMQLRKCCNHPYLFPNIEDRSLDPMGDHLYLNCGKMVLLHKLLTKMKERGHRVLIFTQMTRMLDILEDYMLSHGYAYCRIDGNTTYEDREDRIFDFNREGSDKFVFLLSTRAGGLGINLQTADTVILYDSDWNPQADLQAQDRAHRIGQTKPVIVFRLVTDDSVEVKVVERAQQKLKLDAMVVQQGRLQEKDKKMSKNELLDTLRFGADKIFRSKESSISDADIDMILEEGKKRTAEMNEKMQTTDKGDMFDFRLDGGMNMQVFEGKDYSAKGQRAAAENGDFFFLDIGKRDRRVVASYAETQSRAPAPEDAEKKLKLPKHLKLTKMEDWQFFDRKRLQELQVLEVKLYEELVERGEAPAPGAVAKLIVLPPELQDEKQRLLATGFVDWSKADFQNFHRACAKYGRNEFDKIAKDVNKSVEDVQRYSEVFWARGKEDIANFDTITKNIEKGEKKLEEINRLTVATAKLIGMFEDPWEELSFRNSGAAGRMFTSVEDRYLLCLTHLHGYGSWDEVRNSIRRSERFRFDFFLQSCSTDTIGKRCENLMRLAEKELMEIEKKRQQQEGGSSMNARSHSEATKQRITELSKQIADEARRLAAVRSQMEKLKKVDGTNAKSELKEIDLKELVNEKDSVISVKPPAHEKEKKQKAGGSLANPVPEAYYPDLCRLITEAGGDGIAKIVERFIDIHPEVPKRQVEMKINEFAVKEKREHDSKPTWYLKNEFQKWLQPASSPTSGYKSALTTPKTKSATKRKRDEKDDSDHGGDATSSNLKQPKKFKRAFGLFVKDHREEAEEKLGDVVDKTEALKDLLTKMWEQADQEVKKHYEALEAEDKARYERELAVFKKQTETGQH